MLNYLIVISIDANRRCVFYVFKYFHVIGTSLFTQPRVVCNFYEPTLKIFKLFFGDKAKDLIWIILTRRSKYLFIHRNP